MTFKLKKARPNVQGCSQCGKLRNCERFTPEIVSPLLKELSAREVLLSFRGIRHYRDLPESMYDKLYFLPSMKNCIILYSN